MHVDTQFSVFLVNKPGVLAQVTKSIAKAHVNIVAMTLVDSSEHGVLRFVCDQPEKTREVLKTKNDYWTETEVLVLNLQNRPGVLASVAGDLADVHVNISYAYTSGGGPGGKTTCVFKVADTKKAMKLLGTYNGTDKDGKGQQANLRPSPGRR